MIEFINKRMNEWAAWSLRGRDGGLGYSGSVAYCRLVPTHGTGDVIGIDEDAMEIEFIVSELKRNKPFQFEVAKWFYLSGNVTVDRIAEGLGCSKKTAYIRLHALHQQVLDRMHDLTIEAMDRADEMRAAKNISKVA